MNRKKFFGQVDKPPHIAVSLIDFANLKFNTFFDLGAGLGNLSSSLHGLYPGVMIEIDSERANYLKKYESDALRVYCENFLHISSGFLGDIPKNTTLFLSNPPFHRAKSGYTFSFFENIGIYHQLDIAFLDKAISLSCQTSSLLFIVSAPFISFSSFKQHRKNFFRNLMKSVLLLCLIIYTLVPKLILMRLSPKIQTKIFSL